MNQNSPQNRFDAARAAVDFLEKHGIDPVSRYFDVAFSFVSESNAGLCKEMNKAIHKGVLTAQTLDHIYVEHLQRGMSGEEITALSRKLQNEVASVMIKLTATRKGTEEFSENLSDSDSRLKNAENNPLEIGRILEGMLTETTKMTQLTADMDSQLSSTQREVNDLRARLEEAEREATTDTLTSLANRKGFDMALRKSIEDSVSDTGDLCLILADVDHFKKFNDTHGHQLGDLVLRMVALSMQSETPSPHTVARFGGEEFAIIMPNTDTDGAFSHAERIRKVIEKRKLVKKGEGRSLGRVTVSFGVAKFDRQRPIDHFIEQADKALYAAKRSGRNRVLTENDLQETAFGGR